MFHQISLDQNPNPECPVGNAMKCQLLYCSKCQFFILYVYHSGAFFFFLFSSVYWTHGHLCNIGLGLLLQPVSLINVGRWKRPKCLTNLVTSPQASCPVESASPLGIFAWRSKIQSDSSTFLGRPSIELQSSRRLFFSTSDMLLMKKLLCDGFFLSTALLFLIAFFHFKLYFEIESSICDITVIACVHNWLLSLVANPLLSLPEYLLFFLCIDVVNVFRLIATSDVGSTCLHRVVELNHQAWNLIHRRKKERPTDHAPGDWRRKEEREWARWKNMFISFFV